MRLKLDINLKIWLTIIVIVLVGSLFNYGTTLFLYERLYVEHQGLHLKELGNKIAELYHGNKMNEDFKRKVEEINSISTEEIILSNDPQVLEKTLPIEDCNLNPLTREQREMLQNGKVITIKGEHNYFNRNIIAVAVPLIDKVNNQFTGAVFLYTPLATVDEALSEVKFLFLIYVLIYLFLGIIFGRIITVKMTKPLREMETVARSMMEGNFNAKVQVNSEDEIGQLGKTFNHLTDSLKKMIELLSKEKSQLSQILDGISDNVITLYKNSNITACNGPSKKLFRRLGIKKEQFINIPEIENLIYKVMNKREVLIEEIKIKNNIFVLYLGPLIDEGELWGIVIVIHDVTNERKRENETREFLAVLSHELRTPLSYVKGYTEALIDGVADTKETQERYLTTIHNETERMERLVNDLLDLAQLEKGTYPISRDEILLENIVKQVVERYFSAYEIKGVILEYENKSNKPLWMVGDDDRITQVLVNLLDNALRHTPVGGKVVIESYISEEDIVLQVSDTGEGIEPKYMKKIGQKFFRVDKARSRRKGGTGLGLAIVKQIIERLNGRLEVESEVGRGTTFKIYFPFLEK